MLENDGGPSTKIYLKVLFSRVAYVFFCSILCVVAFFLFAMYQINQPPFDLTLLERLQPGMTADEVKAILGRPDSVYQDGQEWAYAAFLAWPIVYVRFDGEGRFIESEYDY